MRTRPSGSRRCPGRKSSTALTAHAGRPPPRGRGPPVRRLGAPSTAATHATESRLFLRHSAAARSASTSCRSDPSLTAIYSGCVGAIYATTIVTELKRHQGWHMRVPDGCVAVPGLYASRIYHLSTRTTTLRPARDAERAAATGLKKNGARHAKTNTLDACGHAYDALVIGVCHVCPPPRPTARRRSRSGRAC